jgi:hypothetical protein
LAAHSPELFVSFDRKTTPLEENADRHVALPLRRACLVDHSVLAVAAALDAQEQDGKARSGTSRTSAGAGRGSVP